MQPSIVTKRIFKGSMIIIIFIWTGLNLYFLSNKSSTTFTDYSVQLKSKKSSLEEKVHKEVKTGSSALIPVYKELCAINLYENNLPDATRYINALITCSNNLSESERVNILFFVANIFRDFECLDQARIKYKEALSLIDNAVPSNILTGQLALIRARILNNLGITYFLQGKTQSSKRQRLLDYSLAKDYLAKALEIKIVEDRCLKECISTNFDQCVTEMNFSH